MIMLTSCIFSIKEINGKCAQMHLILFDLLPIRPFNRMFGLTEERNICQLNNEI